MSSVPQQYQPSDRLIDDPTRLRELYCDKGLTVMEIADYHAELGRTKVNEALNEYSIIENCEETTDCYDYDPPPASTGDQLGWSTIHRDSQ